MGIADEVLAQLDQAAADFTFPDLNHGYYYAVDNRLTAFGDGSRWALVVETVGYTPRGANLIDVVHSFGNCLAAGAPGFENEDFHSRIDNMEEVETWDNLRYDRMEDESWDEAEDDEDTLSLVVRGHSLVLDAPESDELWDVLRGLVPEHRDLLLGDEGEVRRRLPADLPVLLRLEEWNQPDLFETPPSQSEAYRLIAAVLETRDPSRYRPTLPPNTHWSNWPESGSL